MSCNQWEIRCLYVFEKDINVPGLSRDQFGVLEYAYRHRLGT